MFSSVEIKAKLAAFFVVIWREGVAGLPNVSFQFYQTKRQPSSEQICDTSAASEIYMLARTGFHLLGGVQELLVT